MENHHEVREHHKNDKTEIDKRLSQVLRELGTESQHLGKSPDNANHLDLGAQCQTIQEQLKELRSCPDEIFRKDDKVDCLSKCCDDIQKLIDTRKELRDITSNGTAERREFLEEYMESVQLQLTLHKEMGKTHILLKEIQQQHTEIRNQVTEKDRRGWEKYAEQMHIPRKKMGNNRVCDEELFWELEERSGYVDKLMSLYERQEKEVFQGEVQGDCLKERIACTRKLIKVHKELSDILITPREHTLKRSANFCSQLNNLCDLTAAYDKLDELDIQNQQEILKKIDDLKMMQNLLEKEVPLLEKEALLKGVDLPGLSKEHLRKKNVEYQLAKLRQLRSIIRTLDKISEDLRSVGSFENKQVIPGFEGNDQALNFADRDDITINVYGDYPTHRSVLQGYWEEQRRKERWITKGLVSYDRTKLQQRLRELPEKLKKLENELKELEKDD